MFREVSDGDSHIARYSVPSGLSSGEAHTRLIRILSAQSIGQYGAPGSGKSSTIQSIAGELGLDVYIITLSRAGLDNDALYELIGGLPKQCIALMEDIDAAFKQGIMRGVPLPPATVPPQTREDVETNLPAREPAPFSPLQDTNGVTLSGLLNALDGIGAQEGRILFATTNNVAALDPALIRPGRLDVHVEFRLASKLQAEQLFKCFYDPSTSTSSASTTCLSSEFAPPNGEKTSLDDLASQFAGVIPDRKLSMASLQGYLMSYKLRPQSAIQGAPHWVEGELGSDSSEDGKDTQRSMAPR